LLAVELLTLAILVIIPDATVPTDEQDETKLPGLVGHGRSETACDPTKLVLVFDAFCASTLMRLWLTVVLVTAVGLDPHAPQPNAQIGVICCKPLKNALA
jgi:hypothetical protein